MSVGYYALAHVEVIQEYSHKNKRGDCVLFSITSGLAQRGFALIHMP